MQRWQGGLVALVVAAVFGAATFALGYAAGSDDDAARSAPAGSVGPADASTLRQALAEIRRAAVDPPPTRELVRGAIRGMVDVLKKSGDDPYALFYSPRGYQSFRQLTTGEFSGIGVWLKPTEERLEIDLVLPRTPALDAGLQRGDVIRTIDGEPAGGMTIDEAVARIKGPEGTEVDLGVERDGEMLRFTITRATIDLPNLKARVTERDLGYIRLFGFARGAGDQVRKEVARLVDEGMRGIVLDLRDNGGGLFTEAIEVASVFIEKGEVVTYRERAADDVEYEAEGDAYHDIPLVVLVNEGTASASEIVAGALQDRDRGIVVGTTTYGKGSVQEVVELPDRSALKLTTAAYLTPDGHDIDGKGIEPDVEVEGDASVQRERAVEILRGIVVSSNGAQEG
ncbi:MAG TPA: S41 family peptidase [Actinomycetota bacterium]|nr:S41 family peptidase [Actinomycetota bacterium]